MAHELEWYTEPTPEVTLIGITPKLALVKTWIVDKHVQTFKDSSGMVKNLLNIS